jgi:uncharacterized membrane protein
VSNRNAEWFARVLIVAMFALAIWTWPSAPARIPIHWNISGQIDGYGPKLGSLFLLPVVGLAGYVLIGLTAVIRREQFTERVIAALSLFRLAYVLMMAGVVAVIVADLRGSNINMNYVVLPLLAVMMLASVNLILRLSRLKLSKTAPPGGGVQV